MAWDSVHLFECATRVHYGAGSLAGLPGHLSDLSLQSVVLVSDQGLLAADTVERVEVGADGLINPARADISLDHQALHVF